MAQILTERRGETYFALVRVGKTPAGYDLHEFGPYVTEGIAHGVAQRWLVRRGLAPVTPKKKTLTGRGHRR